MARLLSLMIIALGSITIPLMAEELTAEKPTAEAEIGLTIVPRNIYYQHHINLDDEDGIERRRRFDFRYRVEFDRRLPVMAYARLAVTKVVTDTGEEVVLDDKTSNYERDLRSLHQTRADRTPSTDMTLSIPFPQQACQQLTTVAGTFDVIMASEVKELTLRPLKQLVGKRLVFDDLPESLLEITEVSRREVVVEMSGTIGEQLMDANFFTADGSLLQSSYRANRSGRSGRRFEFRVNEVPDDGQLRLRIALATQSTTVPFVVSNIPSPMLPIGAALPEEEARPQSVFVAVANPLAAEAQEPAQITSEVLPELESGADDF